MRKEKAREGNGERTERGVGGEERERRYGRTETGVSSKKERHTQKIDVKYESNTE